MRELVRHPWRRPERVKALSNVNLDAWQGEMMALLGPNGAGKTTLIKILCGLVTPEEGEALVLGRTVTGGAAASRLVGLVHGEERSFYWRLTARENLQFYARLHGMTGRTMNIRVDELLEKVDLRRDAQRRFGDFSSGMRQRMAIARALLADPPLVLMDEPTRSLDPVSAARLRRWIRDDLHGCERKTILLATHNLREAETLCDRVAVLAGGIVKAVAEPAALRRLGVTGTHYRVHVDRWTAPGLEIGSVVSRSQREDGGTELLVVFDAPHTLDDVLRSIQQEGGRVLGCAPEEPDLEQVFHRLVTDDAAGDGGAGR